MINHFSRGVFTFLPILLLPFFSNSPQRDSGVKQMQPLFFTRIRNSSSNLPPKLPNSAVRLHHHLDADAGISVSDEASMFLLNRLENQSVVLSFDSQLHSLITQKAAFGYVNAPNNRATYKCDFVGSYFYCRSLCSFLVMTFWWCKNTQYSRIKPRFGGNM